MSGLTNQYVEQLGKNLIGKHFLGTFPCDIHPNIKKKTNFFVVFNLSKHGSHFIAICADKKNLMYFDPLGHKCDNEDILTFLNLAKNKRKLKNKFPKIQSCSSIFCGFFCIAFLLSRYHKEPLQLFFKHFNKKNLIENDQTVIDFITRKIYES